MLGIVGCRRLAFDAAGFTMIELMATLSIAAIVLAIGVPSMSGLLQGQRVGAAANDLLASIKLARSEAIARAARVDVVPADGADWSSGWVVFIDDDSDLVPDADEQIIFSHAAVAAGVQIGSNMPAYLSYQGSGRTRTDASAQTAMSGTFTIAADGQERQVRINMLGRARVCNPGSKVQDC